jgi:hypothetical protein
MRPPVIPMLSQINPLHNLQIYSRGGSGDGRKKSARSSELKSFKSTLSYNLKTKNFHLHKLQQFKEDDPDHGCSMT